MSTPEPFSRSPLTDEERMHTVDLLVMSILEGASQSDDVELHEAASEYGLFLHEKLPSHMLAAGLSLLAHRHHRLLKELGLSHG